MPKDEYKKTFEDELDWNLLNQLHNVVLQISTFCFRTKQVCLTVDIAVMGVLIKFTGNTLNDSIFVSGLLIPLGFWFLDSIGFYYQANVRSVMEGIRENLSARNLQSIKVEDQFTVIDPKRRETKKFIKILVSFVNHSMWLYLFLIIADVLLWIAYSKGLIE
jgi:hypothetical protein